MKYSREPIAVIGMGCRYPGAKDSGSFWRLLVAGTDALSDPHHPRVGRELSGFPDPSGPGIGGLLENADCFDADFFDMSPREASCLDPQQRLLLEVAWEAFEDAGLTREQVSGARAGVFIGVWSGDFENNLYAAGVPMDLHLITGVGRFPGPNRISYALDLRGPSIAVDTACSSSLVSIHLACQSIWAGESEFALAGGVNAILRPEITEAFMKANVLSPDRRCKFADISADGYVRSEGAGIVVLKPLSKAARDGDPIYAIIRGSAVNSDGQSNHMLVRPSGVGQEALLRDACEDAGVDPRDVQYVEAHGTGTTAGDPVELGAIGNVFGGADRSSPCLVGSVKTNIGHTEGAAGVAGLIKVVFSLWHSTIPASLHFRQPNPKVPWEKVALKIQTQTSPWPAAETHIAGVTAFGLTGTNAHVILEACPVQYARPRARKQDGGRLYLVPLSAKTSQALDELARSYERYARGAETQVAGIADIAYTAGLRRTHQAERLALAARDPAELREKLDHFLRKESCTGTAWGSKRAGRDKIAFVFPGQGAQWAGMGWQLFRDSPVFRDEIERCDAEMRRVVDWSLLDLFTGFETFPQRIDVIQPALFAISAGLARQWRDWGVEPDSVVGHSMGEVAAAYVSGALSLADAAAVICRRSALMCRVTGQGSMAMVELPMEILKSRISRYADRVSIAASNGATSTVLSGDTAILQNMLAELEAEEIFCRFIKVDVASHSACVDPILDDLRATLEDIHPGHGSIPMYSTVAGTIEQGDKLDHVYWARNLREPVMFGGAIQQLIRDGFGTFIEISPHPLLATSVQGGLAVAGREGLSLSSLKRDEDEHASLLATAGSLYVAGYPLDWTRINGSGRCITLPAYPFQRERVWPNFSSLARGNRQIQNKHAFLANRMELASPQGAWVWEMQIGVPTTPYLADHCVQGHAVFPGTGYLELVLAAAEETEGVACSVEDVKFENALVLPDGVNRQVQLAFSPRSGDSRKFNISGREADGSWRGLASGNLTFRSSLPPVPESAAAILVRCTEVLSCEDYYRRLAERGLQYGTSFQLAEEAWRGKGETLVRIETAKVNLAESRRHIVHPAILDAALQSVGEFFPDIDTASGETYVPVGIDRVCIFQTPKSGVELFAHATLFAHPTKLKSDESFRCDVLLFDGAGQAVAEIRGLLCRSLQRAESGAQCLYELAWTADVEVENASILEAARWIIFADSRGIAGSIASYLETLGHECIVVRPGQTYSAEGSHYRIDPENPADYQRLMSDAGACQGILHLWAPDTERGEDVSCGTLEAAQRLGTRSVVLLVRALAGCGWGQPPRLWIGTAGLYDLAGGDTVSFAQGPVWGLGRVIACEHPELRAVLVDMSPAPEKDEIALLARTLLSKTGEDQIAIRAGRRYLARFRDLAVPKLKAQRIKTGSAAYRLAIGDLGTLDTLGLELALNPDPGPVEVVIAVEAAGLNFIDVLKSLGIYPGVKPGTSPPLGCECAGRVLRVGTGVTDLKPGDAVVAVTPSVLETGMLASHVTVRREFVLAKPTNLSWEEAAAIPLAFITAWYGLHTLAGIRRGEKVLIHAAAGGVGLAAIQLARRAGATVFATAGSAEKRRYLQEIGVEHVFDSRSTAFAAEVLKATGSVGVDIVLNSLSGKLLDAGISVLAPYGRFVEIGKRDIYEDHPLGLLPFRKNLSFFALDLAAMLVERREEVAAIFRQILEDFEDGTLSPLPVKTYPASQASQMFQAMAAAQHIGKLVLTFCEGQVTVNPRRPEQVDFRNGGYLITGGMGGIGLQVARWMVESGARYIILAGRRGPSEEASPAIHEMQASGAIVRVVRADVSKPEDVRSMLSNFGGDFPELRGIIHAAAVVDDVLVSELDPVRLGQVMGPKAYGAWNLDRATAGMDLDFFVMFSSIASVLPQPGHGSYAAANAFLDALARHRRASGKPALAVNWGFWSGTGLAIMAGAEASMREYAARGMRPLSTQQGLEALEYLLGTTAKTAIAFPAVWRKVGESYAAEGVPPVLSDLIQQHAQADPGGTGLTDPLALLCTVPPTHARQVLETHLVSELSRVLGLAPSKIDRDKRLGAMGLDSLMAVVFVRRLNASLGVLLPATAAFNYPTISALTSHVAHKLGVQIETQRQPVPARTPEPANGTESVDELSDEQAIAALLADGGQR